MGLNNNCLKGNAAGSSPTWVIELHAHYQIKNFCKYLPLGKSTKRYGGRPTILTGDEEHEIVVTCQVFQEIGFGLTRDMVENVVMQYLRDMERPNPFLHNKPGKDWWLGFMRRWPNLVERKPQHLPKNRAISLNENTVDVWLSKVKKTLEQAGLDSLGEEELAQRLWNCDETAFATDVASKKILARRGDKNVHETGGGSGREYITVLGCGSASGERLPPYIVYKGKNLWSSWTRNGLAGTLYAVSDSGWMERPHFLQWAKKLFIPSVASKLKTGPVILFMDGHASHINLALIELSREKNLILMCLPSHTTHALQPLDVGVFGPVKKSWGRILKEYKMETCAQVVDKTVFPGLLKQLWDDSFKAAHLSAGFRRAGLCPVTKTNIPKSVYSPSLPNVQQSPVSEVEAESNAKQSPAQSEVEQSPTESEAESNSVTTETVSECNDHIVRVKVSCCKCIETKDITPARLYLREYFSSLIGRKNTQAKKTTRRKVKPLYSGEALTADDIYERIEKEDRQRKEKIKEKEEKAKERKLRYIISVQ